MKSWACVALFATAFLRAAPATAFHTVFDFPVDTFTAVGNNFGTTPRVSEFDGDMAGWTTFIGTTALGGGRLHIRNPGTHYPGPDGTTLDLTEVGYLPTVGADSGDFVVTAVFDAIVPPEGHFYHLTIYTWGSGTTTNEIFGIDIHTINGQTIIEQHMVQLDISKGIYETVTTQNRPIAASELTGQTSFRLSYDYFHRGIRSSFSLDGGVSFESPFDTLFLFGGGRSAGQILLGADPHTVSGSTSTTTTTIATTTTNAPTTTSSPLPTTTVVPTSTTSTTLPLGTCSRTDCLEGFADTLTVRGRGARREIAWAWRRGSALDLAALGNPTATNGTAYALCIRDGGELVFHEDLPAGGSCGKRACWRAIGSRGFLRGHGHAADAVTMLRVVADTPRSGSEVTATIRSPGALAGVAAPVTLQLEAATGTCWTSRIAPDVRSGGRR